MSSRVCLSNKGGLGAVALCLVLVGFILGTRSMEAGPDEASSTVRAIVLFGARERVYKEKL